MGENKISNKKLKCGIVMPISGCEKYSAAHWDKVLMIVKEALKDTDFDVFLVSDSDTTGVIQHRIVTNLYECDMIVCDVSNRNANVMFELGIRLAFDKPTIIIKDEKTNYPFDIAAVEYIEYPSSLEYYEVINFKNKLQNKFLTTYKSSQNKDSEYKSFLSHFGQIEIKAGTLSKKEIVADEYIIKELQELKQLVSSSITEKNKFNNSHTSKDSFFINSRNDLQSFKDSVGRFLNTLNLTSQETINVSDIYSMYMNYFNDETQGMGDEIRSSLKRKGVEIESIIRNFIATGLINRYPHSTITS